MRTIAALTCMTMFALTAAAPAGQLDKDLVPKDPSFVLHVDLEALVASKIGQLAMKNSENGGLMEFRDQIKGEIGLDPFTEFFSATLYCSDFRVEDEGENCVLVVHTTSAIDALVEHVRANPDEAPLVEELVGGRSIWHLNEGADDEGYACILENGDERLVVMGRQKQRIIEGVDVIEGKAGHFTGDGSAMTLKPMAGTLFFVQMGQLGQFADLQPMSELMKEADLVTVQLAEREGDLIVNLALLTGSAEDAQNVHALVNGMLALGRLASREHAELAELTELASSLAVNLDGREVSVTLQHDVEDLIQTLQELQGVGQPLHGMHGIHKADEIEKIKTTGGDTSGGEGGSGWKAQE